jgi:membrane-associated phospholipid phosphatase
VVWVLTTSARLRLLAVADWIFVAVAVAFPRVEPGVHWTTDVLAGGAFATGWLVPLGVILGAVVARPTTQSGEEHAT